MPPGNKPYIPAPAEVIQARKAAGLTQTEAAALVYVTLRNWQYWEAGARRMPPGLWQLFGLKALGKSLPPSES